MPGIIKEVDGKVYVAGGPECDFTCQAWEQDSILEDVECINGRLIGKLTKMRLGVCPACHGTGVQAVQDWPDKVKAEWLFNALDNNVWVTRDGEDWIIIHGDSNAYWLRDDALAIDPDFSAALTAAVIAVAQEVKE
jgi:hypothetical protein